MMSVRKVALVMAGLLLLCPASPAMQRALLRNGFAISHVSHEAHGEYTSLFLNFAKKSFVDVRTSDIVSFEHEDNPVMVASVPASSSSPAPDIAKIVSEASNSQLIDPDLINSVIRFESGFHAHAKSPKGARGLMQLMPATAARMGVSDINDPRANVHGGTRYLRELITYYHNDLGKALAAYNAGPGSVQRYGGIPPYRETRQYVRRIILDFNRKKLAANAVPAEHLPARSPVRASTGQQARGTPVRRAERTVKPT